MSASTSKSNGKKGTKPSSAQKDPESQLQEIQDLLFGQQVSEVSQSIESLSKQNKAQFAEVDKKIDKSITNLKQYFDEQLDDLTNHINKLSDDSSNRAGLIEDDINGLHQHLETFQKQTHNSQDAIESQLISEVEKLASDIDAKYKEMLDRLNKSSGELSNDKISRNSLAKMLVNMANNLEGQPD